jgi:nucleotide-binding universal stress UspA family protein
VHAAPAAGDPGSPGIAADEARRRAGGRILAAAAAAAVADGDRAGSGRPQPSTRLVEADVPANGLMAAARAYGAAAIVVGAHGPPGRGALLGETARRLTTTADVPVVVMPAAAARREPLPD